MWKILLENGNKKHIFWSGGEDRRTLSSAQWGVTMAVLPRWGVQRTEDRGHCPGSPQMISCKVPHFSSCLHLVHQAAYHAFFQLLKKKLSKRKWTQKAFVKCFAPPDSSVWMLRPGLQSGLKSANSQHSPGAVTRLRVVSGSDGSESCLVVSSSPPLYMLITLNIQHKQHSSSPRSTVQWSRLKQSSFIQTSGKL